MIKEVYIQIIYSREKLVYTLEWIDVSPISLPQQLSISRRRDISTIIPQKIPQVGWSNLMAYCFIKG